mgnify:CR=1 FL=1
MKRTGPIVRENAKTVHEPERLDLIVRGGRVVTPEGVLAVVLAGLIVAGAHLGEGHRQSPCGGQQDGSVAIVTAGMHQARLAAGPGAA